MNNDNAEQLKKLAKVFNTDNIITPKEIESVLTAITKLLASFKKQNQELNDETKAVLNVLFNKISDEHNRSLQALSDKNDKTLEEVSRSKKDIDSKITKALSKLEQTVQDVLAMKPENGKDADEEKIVEDVLSKIILPEYDTETPKKIKQKLETLKGDKRLDKSAIKGLEDIVDQSQLNTAISILDQRSQYLINKKVKVDGTTITGDGTDSNPLVVIGGGGGGGNGGSSFNDQTPNTDASYGTLVGDVDGANTTFTVSEGEYLTGKLKVYLNGQLQEQNSTGDWEETTPASGTFDFLVAPTIGDTVTASYETVASSGGIQSVVAGTNVTVDNTDPLNPVVSATGGGGGGTWGSITGTLSDQTDLQSALNAITPNATHTGQVTGATTLTLNKRAIGDQTDTAITADDKILFADADDDSNLKKDTVQGILDLVTNIDETQLDASVNASLDLADSALQSANISDTAYDATSWNGVTTIAPSKNAVRDKIDAMDTTISGKLTSASTITDGFTKTFVGTGANGTYTLRLKIPFAGTITETTSISSAGTATATFKINTTALGGTANSVSSSEQSQAQASANTFSAGDDINVEITSASSLTNMTLSVTYTRALA